MSVFRLCYEVGQCEVSVWSCHEIAMVVFYQIVLHAFCHTPYHADDQWSFALDGIECIESVIYFLFGVIAYRTGVQKHCISLIEVFSVFVSGHLHHAGHYLRISYIHLTSVGFNIKFLHLFRI